MARYMFEIQNCIKVTMEADTAEEARLMVIDSLYNYAEDMIDDCYVSDGKKIEYDEK